MKRFPPKWFGGYLSAVHVHGEEVDVVVLGVKRVLVVRTVVRVAINVAQHQTFQLGAEEQVLVRVRPSSCGNGVDLAVNGTHRILGRALLEGLDVRHMHGRIQGGLLCEQGGIDDLDLVIGAGPGSHECERILAACQLYLDINVINQEFILQEQVHVKTAHHVDDTTTHYVRSSSHEPGISRGPVGDLNRIGRDRNNGTRLSPTMRDSTTSV